jgi:hypothetical protein
MGGRSLRTRVLTIALTLLVACASTATCLAGVVRNATPRDCCAGMSHGCDHIAGPQGTANTPIDCCAEDAPNYYASLTSAFTSALHPPVAVVPIVAVAASLSPPNLRPIAAAPPPRPPASPTYLLVSVFRI